LFFNHERDKSFGKHGFTFNYVVRDIESDKNGKDIEKHLLRQMLFQ